MEMYLRTVSVALACLGAIEGQSVGCGVGIGNENSQGKRPVFLSNLPPGCDNSDVVTVSEGAGKSKRFQKVLFAPPGRSSNPASWYGEDPDGSTFNYIRTADEKIYGSVVDLTENTVWQFSLDADGESVTTMTASQDFTPEADPVQEAEPDSNGDIRKRILEAANLRGNQQQDRELQDDLGGTLDVMVVWTKKAECKNSGVSTEEFFIYSFRHSIFVGI